MKTCIHNRTEKQQCAKCNEARKQFCVVYRTGGTERFKWHRTIAGTKEETIKRLAEVQAMGYKAHMSDYDSSMAIGLPETYS